jgi:LysR family hydrogen peroxide-inducible transcriptional activator
MPNLARTSCATKWAASNRNQYGGITILPKPATERLNPQQQAKLRAFAPPKPAREVSLITVQDFPRKKLLQHLKETILEAVQDRVITDKKGLNVLEME